MNHSFDKTFSPKFDVLFREEPTDSVSEYCYPGAIEGGFVKGVSIEIIPEQRSRWFASFAAGKLSANAASAVITMPNRDHVLVISSGEAYIVDAGDPQNWHHLNLVPVMGWLTAPKLSLILLWDFSRVVAYGRTGVVWKTPSISWDGISCLSVDDKEVVFKVWNAPTECHQTATVELATGRVKGGTSPEIQVLGG